MLTRADDLPHVRGMAETMPRVLIVDDELLVAETLSRIFEKNGFSTCAVGTTDAAVRSVRDFAPDLLLCDLHLAGGDGSRLMSEMERMLPTCPVLVLSANAGGEARVERLTQETGRRISLLHKPCSPVDLLREAGRMLAA